MVSPCSDRIARVPPYSRLKQSGTRTGLSPAAARLSSRFRLGLLEHWPHPRSLATTNGVSLMSFPPGTEMFQFPGFAFVSYVFRNKYLLLISASPSPGSDQNSELQISKVGFPIRKFTDQRLFAAPRDLSQRTTSFIASQRQGIHRIPLRHLIALIIDAHFSSAAKDLRFIARAIQWARSKRPACFKYTRGRRGHATPAQDCACPGPKPPEQPDVFPLHDVR